MTPAQVLAIAALSPAGRAAGGRAMAGDGSSPASSPTPPRTAARSAEIDEQFDVATYTMIRLWIEAGNAYLVFFRARGRWPEADPSIDRLVSSVLAHLPADYFSLTPAELQAVAAWDDGSPARAGRLPPELRRGDVVFRDRDLLIQTLNERNPAAAAEVKALAPDADDGDVEWWAIALASPFAGGLLAAGILHSIGALSWRGVLLSQISGYLLIATNVAAEVPIHTERGRQVAAAAWEKIKTEAAAAADGIWRTVAMVVGGVLGTILLIVLVVLGVRGAARAA